MKRTIFSLAGIILLVAAIRIPLLGIPFERDEGEYATSPGGPGWASCRIGIGLTKNRPAFFGLTNWR